MTLAQKLGKLLLERKQTVTAAESCTGGLICAAITDISGSSDWFGRGFVAYANQAKIEMLGVSEAMLQVYGAVSEPVARAMATGACRAAKADWAVAVSGIAGPTGGSVEKPVGTIWLAWVGPGVDESELCHFKGGRAEVREQTVQHALARLVELIGGQA
ncbi:nicotinamide-nucleotide amidase [Formivibrio citricus]|uniref:Nicotinamide-nucleotide amidase n=1 Tax=Formivibrio citricus TaxID=83765 RepID=A0A1I5BAY7_9NEIS|nr:CinA family protein [Formivibrio citricus]SFN71875.1 nicotinamide-nucleotide amidase [Formivibrio citricus]